MNKTIQFRDIEHVAHLDEFVDEQLEHIVARFERDRPFTARAVIAKETSRTEPFRAEFSCEIILGHPSLRGSTIVVRKTSDDFHQAVRMACHGVEKILRKYSSMRTKARRHGEDVEPPSIEPETAAV